MKRKYDIVYLTNTPSFYKLNLCNEIARSHSLLLVLYGYGNEAINKELNASGNSGFDYYFLNEGDSNKRNKWQTFWNLLKLMTHVKYRKVIYAGWLAPEYNLYAFLSPKKRNVMVCESSVFDVSFRGIPGIIKKAIINRMGAVLPSGKPHDDLFKSIEFQGKRNITGSVGIFNKLNRKEKTIHRPLRYLYAGRLVDVKNIILLVEEFNDNGKPLTIVGSGPLEEDLKQSANDNISFTGFIDNEKLGEIYQAHDVFVLPSCSETWGLVVEEAIYWGLPVIVSDKVGSSVDMVKDLGTGLIFQSKSGESLHAAIEEVERLFDGYCSNVAKVDWNQRDKNQLEAYRSLLN
jgi:glycosyltransferase involved in cell wall biosynthesis